MAKLTDDQKAKLRERLKSLSSDERAAVVDVLADEILAALTVKAPAKAADEPGFFAKLFGD